jgi:uncharacterized protein (TIGR02646 family)
MVVLEALRRDFGCRCCYCTGSEDEKGGVENFDVEHFRPKSDARFSHLAFEYSNLYYSCRGCNVAKGVKWPEPSAQDQKFIDPCEEAIYPKYLQITAGEIRPSQPPGAFLIEAFKFDKRPSIRRLLQLREFNSKWRSAIRRGDFSEAKAVLDRAEQGPPFR